jgi:hypothetical protein
MTTMLRGCGTGCEKRQHHTGTNSLGNDGHSVHQSPSG